MARARGGDDDSPPWLEPAALSEDGDTILSRKWLIGGAAVFVVALVGTLVAISSGEKTDPYGSAIVAGENGEPPLILAPKEPFREKPLDPGGMKVDGEGMMIGQVASGKDPAPEIKLATGPEQPVERPAPPPPPELQQLQAEPAQGTEGPTQLVPPAAQAPKTAAAPKPEAKAEEAKPEAPRKPAYFLQLGAFSSIERANAGWQQFSQKYEKELEKLSPDIQPVKTGNKTMYRLRAGPVSLKVRADSLCARLKKAGQPCLVADQ
ncbi:SPOR domain-containing protein [Pedomonas mirosovicensis]|uniref:SPOR domain-containing protein n=1 Tax=Pedomonas mirosovicensis TaxID=2908641 RepID=UPI002167EA60|nr:SPOR domain-containing protein [Pedomonas mirosovicensis]MCH8685558.1 SPOR domain-containing protein [Pedomonas mirosovicensis]